MTLFRPDRRWTWQEKAIAKEIVDKLKAGLINVSQAYREGVRRLPGRTYASVRAHILAGRKT